jgi:type I restriction enzyme S subunit
MKQGKMSRSRLSGLKDEQDLGTQKIRKSSNQANPDADNRKQGNAPSLPKGWEIKKLGEVCDFQGGSQPPKSQFIYEPRKGYVRFLQIRDFESDKNITYIPESKKNRYCNEEDILLGRYGASVGKVLVNKAGAYNVAMMKTIPNESILYKRYLYYYLNTEDFQTRLLNTASRSAQNGFSKDDIFDFPILLPPLPEQQRIVSILDKCFAAIAKAKANAEQNLKNAKELFESYLQGVFEKKGEGWEEKRLGEVCDFRNGAAHEQHIDEDGKYILVNSKFISADGEKFKKTNSALAPLYVNDIAFVMSDVPNGKALAKCFLVDRNDTYTLNQRIGAIKSKVFVPKFLFYQFNRNKYLLSFNNGENQTNLRKGDILKCPLWLPPLKEQQTIVRQLDALRAETQKLEAVYQKKIADLEELKKSVLQKAFSGQLSASGLAGLKDEQDLSNAKKSGKSLNQLNPDSDNLKDEQDLNLIKKSRKSLNPVNPDSDKYSVNPLIQKS